MEQIATTLQRAPELALFLSLAIGYAVGKIPLAGVTLGATVSTLLAAVAIGQVGITIDPVLKSVLFALFIFTVGYRGGPQFFASFRRDAGQELAFALVLAAAALVTTIAVVRAFGLDPGAAGGLMAGALTQSPALGTTTDGIARLGLDPQQTNALVQSATVAYAVTYLFGEFGLLVYARNVAPWLLGVDLKTAAAALEAEHRQPGSSAELGEGQLLAYHPLDARAYRVTNAEINGLSIADLEARLGGRAYVTRVQRGTAVQPARLNLRLAADDLIGIVARRDVLTDKACPLIGSEVDAPELLGVVLLSVDVVVANPEFDGRTLRELARTFGAATRGLSVLSIHRVQQPIPVASGTRLQRGDVVRLVGDEEHVRTAANRLGYADWPSDKSDLVLIGTGIVAGTLIGLISIPLVGIPLTLGAGGGILLSGLVLGWLRAKWPTFGKVPPAAQWILSDFGLNGFIAAVGLSVGPTAVHAIAAQGASLLLAGVIVTLTPLIVGTYFGKLVLKMNPVILCGALAGAQTNAAVLNAVSEAADSSMPVLGFTLPFALNNMLLTIAAPIIVMIVGR